MNEYKAVSFKTKSNTFLINTNLNNIRNFEVLSVFANGYQCSAHLN